MVCTYIFFYSGLNIDLVLSARSPEFTPRWDDATLRHYVNT